MITKERIKSAVTYRMIAEALFENYESIYDIHMQTNAYKTYFQSESYRSLRLAKEGENFFADLPAGIRRIIAPEDQDYVLRMLQKETLAAGLEKEKYYGLVYRIRRNESIVYHQLRATLQEAEDGMHILMGIRDVDDTIRQRISYENRVESMQQKEKNHLEAVLETAAAYMEANLTRDRMIEITTGDRTEEKRQVLEIPSVSEIPSYDEMLEWIAAHLIAEHKEAFLRISDRSGLMEGYATGAKRASVYFSIYTKDGRIQPCRALFFLYREKTTSDLHVFCLIYDLTEQQQKELEMKKLEEELLISRIHNSTSQMQPHFLYNALGSIQELVLINPQYASDLLEDFMVHLRSCVRAMSNDDPIRFCEEEKNIQAYVRIEKMRLGDRLTMVYDIAAEDFPVVPLSIQPIVENAIRHGVRMRGKQGGSVTLRTWEESDAWIVQVEDTGAGFDVENVREGANFRKKDSTGLDNVRFRLKKVMGASMEIRSTKGVGTKVTVRIPKG